MKLGDFKTIIRGIVPGAKIQVIDDPTLILLINQGVQIVNTLAMALVKSAMFNVVAEKSVYSIPTEVLSDFEKPGPSGLWWYNGTEWEELDAYTLLQLRKEFPGWLNDSSGDPQRYVLSGDSLIIHPKADTSATNGFKFDDYLSSTVNMATDEHYPFTGSTTELVRLRLLDDAIIDYVRWRLQLMVGKDEKGVISEQDFYNTVNTRMGIINTRPDFHSNPDFRMKGPRIGRR